MSMEKIAEEKRELIRYLTKVAAVRIIEDEMLKTWMKNANVEQEKTASSEQEAELYYLAQVGQQALQKQAQENAVAQLLEMLPKQASATQQQPSPQEQLMGLLKAAAEEQEKEAANANLMKLLAALGIGAAGYGANEYSGEIGDLFSGLGSTAQDASSGIGDFLGNAGGTISDGVSSAGNGIQDLLGSLKDIDLSSILGG